LRLKANESDITLRLCVVQHQQNVEIPPGSSFG